MNQKLGYVAILGVALMMSSCGKKLGQFSADYFTTNPNPLEVVGEKVPATVTGHVPSKFFVKNAEVTVTPYLVFDGQQVASQAYSFQGENVRGNAPVISYENGGNVTIPVSFDYQPAMAQSVLELAFDVTQGGKQYTLPRVQVATGVVATAALADVATVTPAIGSDKFQRVINEKYAADIMFLINVANIRANQLNTNAMNELWSEVDATKTNDRRVMKEINIESYASPDGGYDFNYKLAEKRETNTDNYVRKQLQQQKVTEFGNLTANFTAEDWEGFKTLVEKSNIQDKELILNVLTMYKDPEERETQLRYLASVFEQLADQILPQLRYSRITASIDVIGKTDEELLAAAKSDPKSLTVEELLYAATLTDDPALQEQFYKAATEAYPNDYRTWNNLGMVQYEQGKYAEAKASFEKSNSVQKNQEANMNLALINMLDGNYSDAKNLLGQAGGVDELSDALGTYYLKMGDNAAAANAFGDTKSNNAALAQILTKDYSKARNTLQAINSPDAVTYYLQAVLAARTNGDAGTVLSYLQKASQMDPALGQQALTDLEFSNYDVSSIVK
ncbi:MAG: hypothetical protein LIP09_02875 [Bacteroidales bacterium]|nr:hypothetical protein [Bacteroidales bacterium]